MQAPNCQACKKYLFFLITANVEVDGSVPVDTLDLSCNIAQGIW